MELWYNDVRMELLTLDRVERHAVYDSSQTDLLYVDWTIGASCVFARGGLPVATSTRDLSDATQAAVYGLGSPGGGGARGLDPRIPTFTQTANTPGEQYGGLNGILTDAEVKARLWTPRRKLQIFAYDQTGRKIVWMESPRDGAICDAANGPHPLAVDVVEATGDGATLGIYFQISTKIPPCPAGSDRLVLSHRWEMSHTHDDNFYLTRVIKGDIIFNSAMIAKHGIRPDLVRNQFIHPIPLGFRRGGPQITQSADGLTIGYTIADTDPTVMFDAGDSGATRMDIVEMMAYESPWGL